MGLRKRTCRGEQEEEASTSKSEQTAAAGRAVSPATALDQHEDHDGPSDDEDGNDSVSDGGELMIDDGQNKSDSEEPESSEKVKLTPNSGTMTRRQSKQAQQGAGGATQVKSSSTISASDSTTSSTEPTPGSPSKRQDKNKNRTCSYCGVVKPTPAALIRHLRKHTGEKPFVCSHCGKSYKAKRSLHLHLSSNHKEGLDLPVSLAGSLSSSPSFSTTTTTTVANISNINNIISAAAAAASSSSQLFTQVPFSLPLVVVVQLRCNMPNGHNLTVKKKLNLHLTPPQAVSESTKSLLRETLESSRKAKDGSSTQAQLSEGADPGEEVSSGPGSDRLSTPNLVNLLTSDIGIKMAQAAIAGASPQMTIKSESPLQAPQEVIEREDLSLKQEEQAEDLSMSTTAAVVKKSPASNATSTVSAITRTTSMERKLKCEFCSKTFKHEISRANHTRTAHGIVVNYLDNTESLPSQQQLPHQQQLSLIEHHLKLQQQQQKQQQIKSSKSPQGPSTTQLPLSVLSLVGSGIKQSQGNNRGSPQQYKQEVPTDLSISRKIKESQYALVTQEVIKADLPSVAVTSGSVSNGDKDGPLMDESNTLPYHVTSKMAQDFDLDELSVKEEEWPVLAEDGGQRKLRITVTKESILATRLDGINNITGRRATVFKCHLCQRVFSSLLRFTIHLPSHHDTEVQTYDCRYCDASFRSHIQIVKHLQCHREKFSGQNHTGSSALLLEEFNRKHKQDTAEASVSGNSNTSSSNSKNTSFSSPGGNLPHVLSPVLTSDESADKMSGKAKYTSLRKNLSTPDPRQTASSDSNNNTAMSRSRNVSSNSNSKSSTSNSSAYAPSGMYSQGDTMKAFDLRRGEEVEVRSNSDMKDSDALRQRQALVQHYEFQALMMMKAAEMAGTGNLPGNGGHGGPAVTAEQLMERAKSLRALSEMAARGTHISASQGMTSMPEQPPAGSRTSGLEDLSVQRKRKLEGEDGPARKRREAQEAEDLRQRREREKRLRIQEQQQLKEKLAQEGMGDVTVVLPDAPPMEPTDLSASAPPLAPSSSPSTSLSAATLALIRDSVQPAPPPAGVGFMARKNGGSSVKVETAGNTASRIDNVLKKEYGSGSSASLDGERTILTIDLTKSAVKRPPSATGLTPSSTSAMPANSNTAPVTQASSSTAAAAAVGPPPAKSRRKAHKPQRINHCPEEMECGEVVEGNKTTTQEVDNNRGSDAASNRGSSGVESNGGQLTTTVAAAAPVRASSETKPSVNVDKKESSRDVREKKVNEASPATWMDVAENLSTKAPAAPAANPSPANAPVTTAAPASTATVPTAPGAAPGAAPTGLLDAATLQSQLGQQQLLAGLMTLGALGGAMPASTVTPTSANAAGDLMRKQLEMVLARAAQGSANALLGGPVNAAAAAPLYMSRYLMAGLANIGNMAAMNGGVAPVAVNGGGLFGAGNPASVYSAMAACAATTASADAGSANNSANNNTNTAASTNNTGSNSNNSNGEATAIDLSRDSKVSVSTNNSASSNKSCVYQTYMSKAAAVAVSSSSSSLPSVVASPQPLLVNGTSTLPVRKSSTSANEGIDIAKQQDSNKQRKVRPGNFMRSISLDPSSLDNGSDSDIPLSLTTGGNRNAAADFTKSSLLSVQVPLPGGNGPSWRHDNDSGEDITPENFLGVTGQGLANSKGVCSKSQGSSPSPAPSPTSSEASADLQRKATTTSLSRTHSRLSVVQEPVDRNSLCKPKVLEDGRSVYSCAICHKNFLSLSDINRHMDFHEDIRPYKCQYCDYYARTNSQLKVHKLRHEGVREFCCRVCNYKGVTQSDLNRHMKSQVHLLRSNNVCSRCGEGFVTPKALRDHQGSCTGQADKSMEEDAILGLGEENGTGGGIGNRGIGDEDDEMAYNEEEEDEYEQEERLNMEEAGMVLAV